MSRDLSPSDISLWGDEKVIHETGSGPSGPTMFYWLVEDSSNPSETVSWSQPIPSDVALAEGEYYALIKGLRETISRGHSVAEIVTNSPPIIDQLRDGECPSDELLPFYETAAQLIEQFEKARIMAYAVDMRPTN